MKYIKNILLLILLLPTVVNAYTKSTIDITKSSISDLQEALTKGYTTSEELVTLYLERIEVYDSKFNSINQINKNALEEAKTLDKEREEGKVKGPLHGIPILVKTNIDVKGLATTAGSKALKDNMPNDDSYIVKKLRENGAIILGSTNMSEFAFSASNSYSSYGTVRNAHDTTKTPYGSSGGSAVAVALSFASASLGTDTNSSVRLPAAAAGLVGIKPSLGLVSRQGIIPYDIERDTAGVISKTVKDNALILNIIASYDENDTKSKEIEHQDYSNIDNNIKGLKVAVINSYLDGSSNGTGPNAKTDTKIAKLLHENLDKISNNGLDIIYIDKLLNSSYQSISGATSTGITFCDGFNDYIKNTTGPIRSFKDLSKSSGKTQSIAGYLSGCGHNWSTTSINKKKKTLENYIIKFMEDNEVDVIVYPTLKHTIASLPNSSSQYSPGSFLGSAIGYPSITVPVGYVDGLPYGLEIFSLKYKEDTLYKVAAFFEETIDLGIPNSTLAPNLYEIPGYLDDLKKIYEEYIDDINYQDITKKVQEYFKAYSSMSDEASLENYNILIEEYSYREQNLHIIEKTNSVLSRELYLVITTIVLRIITITIKRTHSK